MAAHFAHHLLTALAVPLLPFIRDSFALDYTQSALVISVFTLSYGIGQLPGGWFADRTEPRILIAVGISGVALVGLLVGLSRTYIMMVILLGLMGLVGGSYHPATPPLVSASVQPQNQGRALGLHAIGGSASHFLAPLIAVALAAKHGWRSPYIALAIPTMIFGLVFYALLGQRLATTKAERAITSKNRETRHAPSHSRRLIVFIILSTSTQAVFLSVIPFIPLFLIDHFGISRDTSAALIAVIYSSGLWAAPLGGYLSDRLGRVPVILTVCFIAGPVIYLLNLIPYGWGFGALLATMGMLIYVRMPVSEAYIVRQASGHNRSTILGIYYLSSNEASSILTQVLGYFIDRLGFYTSFTIAGASVMVTTLVCSIWLRGSRD